MHWEDTTTRDQSDLVARTSVTSDRHAWRGLTVYRTHSDGDVDIPEGHLLNHVLGWRTRGETGAASEYRIQGSGWKRYSSAPVTFHPAGMPYALRVRGASEVVAIELTPDFVSACRGADTQARVDFQFLATEDPLLIHISQALLLEAQSGASHGELYGHSLGAALVAHVLKKCHAGTATDHVRGLPPRLLQHVIEYVHEHLEHDLSLPELARIAETGMDRFVRAFRQSTGTSPHQYVLQARIDRARALLFNGSLTLTEIAARTGFADQSHFSRTFRRMTGLSPQKYRKAQQ